MPRPITDGRLKIDFSFQPAEVSTPADGDTYFPIVILGDFSGRANRTSDTPGIAAQIDYDNFEQVLAKFDVSLPLASTGPGSEQQTVRFRHLEDFHPDRLIHQITTFSRLFDLRGRLLDPAHAGGAVAEAEAILKREVTESAPLPATSTETTEELFTRLLGKPATAEPKRTPAASKLDELIKQIVAPSVVPEPSIEQSQLVQLIENELSKGLRDLLHDPKLQALESSWRGIDFLIREAGEQIQFYLINIEKGELASLIVGCDFTKTAIFKHLEQIGPALLLGLYTFGLEDHRLLGSIGSFAAALQTTLVGGASPQLVGCNSFGLQADSDDWATAPVLAEFDALRRMPQSAHLGLLMPRFLLRQPYGLNSDPIESFPFQETSYPFEHESYLWGNPALLCGYLLADAFAAEGWDLDTSEGGQIFGLPVYTFTAGGENQVKPCAEAWLSEKTTELIRRRGFTPVGSIRGRDAVEIRALQSFSLPPRPLIIRSRG
ncbi:MAG: type VI secretion system contractile sheath large subunit [Verrucomicrobia bacterium]|nr:type VI secretion system contractile sheath large subunit [Verrucomicrobiota bacterium]